MREKKRCRWLALLLAVVMLLSVLPTAVFAEGESGNTFYRIFHLDCGRKYFTVDQVKTLIDTLAANHYTHIELAIGNDGLRFLLDDMSVDTNGDGTADYESEAVKAGIRAGNTAYYNDPNGNALTETEMNTIISYAASKSIEIIPLVNTPGHMDAILDCMEYVGISDPAYSGSTRTVDVTNTAAVNFTLALVNKYIQYFAGKGCTRFNMGCDEYANDVSNSGFAGLISSGKYGNFITYVNNMAAQVKAAGMIPMAFNDGIYYNSNTSSGTFDTDIVIAYWTSGFRGYSPASASFLAQKGHKIISTNDAWYYVLGRQAGNSSGYTIATAQNGVQNTACTDIPGDNDPTAAGCMICLWCDTPSASYSNTEVSNVTGLLTTFATNNPTYFAASGETDPTDPGEGTENKTITVTVGQTATDTIEGADYSNNIVETELNKSIATVSAQYEQITGGTEEVKATSITSGSSYYIKNSSGQYLSSNASWVSDISSAALWTATSSGSDYTLKNGNKYLRYQYGSLRTTTYSWNATTWAFSSGTFSYTQYSWGDTTTYTLGDAYTVTTTDPVNATTVTFTGVAVGTTYVTVGNTRYTINVLAEDLSGVTPLTVEYWITNLPVTAGGATSKQISAQSAYGEAGVDISTLVPATGTYAYGSVVYWKGTVLDSNNKQTSAGGVENDKTGSGKDFNLIRYYNGSWQYFYEADGTWNTISSTDQVVIYWLQPTEVTKEITTLVKDWGFKPNDQKDNENKVALTVAVVYPDGTVSPAEGEMYSTSTTLFNYWSGRDIGLVAPVNNSDYVISKMTVTDGTRDQSGTGKWGANDTITWEKETLEDGSTWYKETTYWDETVGGTPMVNGHTSNITWSNYNTAKLVLIYLKPVHYDTNLTVKWVDDSAGGALISTMEVAVSSDGTPITFYNGLKQTSALPTEGVGGTFTLDNDAYVTNSSNVNQTFNKNISTVPNVAEQYKSGLYSYVSADLSADGKTLTLHYNIDASKLSKTFVVDFGLPISIPLSEFLKNPDEASVTLENNCVSPVGAGDANYDEINSSIVFTPSAVLNDAVAISVKVTFADESQKTLRIGILPASNVLYEAEKFTTADDTWESTVVYDDTASSSWNCLADYIDSVYGYTEEYATSVGAGKGGGVHAKLSENHFTGDLSFSFKGTGFDLIAQCGEATGTLMVRVDNSKGYYKSYLVDTSFSDVKFVDENRQINLYQVPVIHAQNWPEDTYTVTVRGAYIAYGAASNSNASPASTFSMRSVGTSAMDTIYELADQMGLSGDDLDSMEFINVDQLYGASTYAMRSTSTMATTAVAGPTALSTPAPTELTVYIDAFRVYRPDSQLYKDTEKRMEYVNVLDAVYGSFVGYVESNGDGSYTSGNYETSGGPQNEIYLSAGKAVTFQTGLQKDKVVQVSARAVSGTAYLNDRTEGITSNTEMYYEVTVGENGVITIANGTNATGMLAIANLKVPEETKFDTLTEQTFVTAFAMMRSYSAAPAEPDPEQPGTEEPAPKPVFTPETFKTKVSSLRTRSRKVVTLTITASTDVDHVVVNGKTYYPVNKLLVKLGWSKTCVFTIVDTAGASETRNFEIVAYNADGLASITYTDAG